MPDLFVDISAHGLGHLAQTAPVLNALRQALPELRLTIRSGLPLESLARRILAPFEFIPGEPDFGYAMRNALDIDLAKSASLYQDRHKRWSHAVSDEADFLRQQRPDLVLSNVAYLPLAGAARAGIPAVAMCSLNWADLFVHHFGHESWAAALHADMLSAYRSASVFLRITPGMPMPALQNLHPIGPIAEVRPPQRGQIAERLGLRLAERWVLVALGGIEHRLPVPQWPRQPGVRWLVADDWQVARDDISAYDKSIAFVDMLASADALITKAGYGSFAESACNGIPVLYLRRPDWPEDSCLVDWLREHNRCVEITRADANSGAIAHHLEEIWRATPPQRPLPSGLEQACASLTRLLTAAK